MSSERAGKAGYKVSLRGKSRRDARRKARGGKGGMVLILALGVLVLVSMLAIFFYTVTRGEKEISADEVNLTHAEMLAQTGLEVVKTQLRRPPRDVAWSDPIEIKTYFELPMEDLGDTTTRILPQHHPDTPFFVDDDAVVVPGFADRGTDEFSIKSAAAIPTFLRGRFSDGEPFEDTGYNHPAYGANYGVGDRIFSFYDANGNGVHDKNETLHEPFSPEQDLNNNGVHDSYSGAVAFAVDDNRGTYSLSVLDNGGLIYINDGTMLGDDWLPEWAENHYSSDRRKRLRKWLVNQHSRHMVKILDNLGVILGMFTEEETYYRDDVYDRLRPTGEGLGYLLIYGNKHYDIDGRPDGGYTSKREVRRMLSEIRREVQPSLTDARIDLFLQMITTVAWVDKTTVVGARFLYPEECLEYLGEERNDYIKLEPLDEMAWYDPDSPYPPMYEHVIRLRGCNPTGVLVPGRAEEDAEPRYGEPPFGKPQDAKVFEDVPAYLLPEYDPFDKPGIIEGFDKDDDLDNLMGWLYEPRAPVNINSAPQPVIEAVLTYLEATYVTDRENNLYPNDSVIADYRTGEMVDQGTPAYNFYYNTNDKWDRLDKQANYYFMWGGLYNWYRYSRMDDSFEAWAEEIVEIIDRVNPTIRGAAEVIILPEEARAIAAAIVEYRDGGDSFPADVDRNGNGILDFGDDEDGDGVLEEGEEWIDRTGDGYYQGGTFQGLEEFWVFLNMQKYRLFSQVEMIPDEEQSILYGIPFRENRREDSRATNLINMKVDLIFANANPNVDTMQFNPNASWASLNRVAAGESKDERRYYLRRNVTRFDLFDVEGRPTHTTEFCFQPTGVFQIEATGRVLAADGTLLAERRIRSAVKVFDTMRLTSQMDFEMGPNPEEYDEDDITTHDDYFFNPNIAEKDQVMTLPEAEWRATGLDGNPRKSDWQANAAGYDGQITLATTFVNDTDMEDSRAGPYALRAYARFSAGEGGDRDTLGGRFTSTSESSHVQDELNLRLSTFNRMGWIRAAGNLRRDWWEEYDPDYEATHNWDYDYENHKIHTGYDMNCNGELDYERSVEYEEWPGQYHLAGGEATAEIIIRPLMEPEQYPVVGYQCTAYSGSYEMGIFKEKVLLFPFFLCAYQKYNNYHVYPMTVPRYDRESNLVPDGFLKCGSRRIYYDMDTYGSINEPRTTQETELIEEFVDSMIFNEWYAGTGGNCLTLLVEMWVKPMFSAVDNDNSVHDGNWEEMMKVSTNWRWRSWTPPPPYQKVHPEKYHPIDSWLRLTKIPFTYPYYNYSTAEYSFLRPPQMGPYEASGGMWEVGTYMDVKFRLQPLQFERYERMDQPYTWLRRRSVLFGFDDYWKQYTGGDDEPPFRFKSSYTDDPDPDGAPPHDVNHIIRDGEWFHFAFVCLKDEVFWALNGKCIGSEMLPANQEDFANFGIQSITLPEFACTVDEFKIYTMLGNSISDVGTRLLEHLQEGRYFDEGTYTSPEIRLPKGARLEGINWTQFIPITLDPDDTSVTVYLLDDRGRTVKDENGNTVKLEDPNNTDIIGTFIDSFKLKIEIEAAPNPDYYDSPMRDCLIDTPVVDDITIFYSFQEEVLLWELVE